MCVVLSLLDWLTLKVDALRFPEGVNVSYQPTNQPTKKQHINKKRRNKQGN